MPRAGEKLRDSGPGYTMPLGASLLEESRNRSHFASPLTLARLFVLFKEAGQRRYRYDRFLPFAETLRSFTKNAREANAT